MKIKHSGRSSKRKIVTITSILLTLLLIIVSVVLVLDYKKYSNFQSSQFFGSKDVYRQDQPLYFDNLKVTVSEVQHKSYDYQTTDSCMKIAEKAGALIRANNYVKTDEWYILSSKSEQCMRLAELYETKKMVVVHFFLENLSDSPLDVSKYDIKVLGHEKAESTKPENKIPTLFARQSKYNSFVIHHLPKDNDGPFALIVTKDGSQKQISLNLPKLAPFCTGGQCSIENSERKY